MKQCKDCKKNKAQTEFYGVQGECKVCTRKRVQLNYRNNLPHYILYEKNRWEDPKRRAKAIIYQRTRRAKSPGKYKAYMKVNYAIRSGRLFRKPCEVCGNLKVEAHHEDYRKWLKVKWLCRKHHKQVEGKLSYEGF